MDTPQTSTQTVLEHGISVHKYFNDLFQELINGSELKFNWKLPQWLTDNKKFIVDNLHNYEIVKEYQLMHDCGKPYCMEIGFDGKRHFPDHAKKSHEIFSKISDNKIVADLILKDMDLHLIKSDDVDSFVENNSVETIITLLVTALCELHSNAEMFGGIDSTSFKIKFKQSDKRGKQILKLITKETILI